MQRVEHYSSTYSTPVHGLSARELEVLKLMVEGQSNLEIAAHLYLSQHTVKTHVRSIFNKLGVGHRVQAAVIALRQGLI
ncbi:response regulator transcription factor [Leptolyngbya sp. FACHB-671]|nr:response regulator transcription factor [Cyanobacteria bacterium FACHB-471]MBD2000099.1 response regulator transcription factor [Leptolyngbya sp. FACHB-541]MBD2066411.1 response regulator transcription factor [Leptolyngbya sp. FACHB-671]